MTADARTRHNRGLLVVILLGVIFFAILGAIILTPRHASSQTQAVAETYTVLPLRIRLRTEPNAKAPVVATATSGEKLTLIEDRGAWVRVQNDDGLTGWAERSALERTNEREARLARYGAIRKLPPLAGIVSEHTTLYAGPGIFYPIVGDLPSNTQVHVFTRDHDFYAIDYQDQVGYADIDTIDVSAAGTKQVDVATTSAAPTATDTTATTASTDTTATEEPPEQPAPSVAPEMSADRAGVYAAVPAGGTQPEETNRVIPRYPAMARRSGVAGAVVIRGIVRKDGTIDNVEIIKDLPYGLGDAAREAVEQWRFRPATYRGEPIDVYYTVTVNFKLQ
ncbi:MAG TPA: TonB family protein [Thermoanaerobaculia bacterium]|nr:TonB family protein [Thermoanaerobaculia bacterium]